MELQKSNKTKKQQFKKELQMYFITFVLMPIITVPAAIYQYCNSKGLDKKNITFLFVALACYMAVINASKFPGGDQANYWAVYMKVPQEGLIWAINHIYGYRDSTEGKEFMNGFYNFFGYYLTAGRYGLYIFINTILVYIPFFYVTKELYQDKKNGKYAILAGIICLCFFTQFFNLTIHLQRQVLAFSIFIFAMYRKAKTGKTNYLLLFVAIFTHSTILFFIPFLYFNLFYERMTIKRAIQVLVLGLAIIFVVSRIMVSKEIEQMSDNALSYSLNRIHNGGGTDDVEFHLANFLVFNIPILYVSVKRMFLKGLNRMEYVVNNTYLLLFIFVLSFTGNDLVQYRFSFFTYGYIGFLLPALLKGSNRYCKTYYLIISVFFVARFYLTFDQITWSYDPIWKSLLFPEFINTLFPGYGDISKYL